MHMHMNMNMNLNSHQQHGLLIVLMVSLQLLVDVATAIGVNYGMLGDNLPPPPQVAEFLKTKTIIDKVKIFDANPEVIRAFANTGIALAITAANGDIANLAQPAGAQQWIAAKVAPFYPATNIDKVLIGSEVLHWGPPAAIDNLVPAMRSMRQALDQAGFNKIQVTTAHSLIILETSWPPSSGAFRPGWDRSILGPMLEFHKETKSPFMVNPYPYFASNQNNVQYCVFQDPKGMIDPRTKKVYHNMFDSLIDAVKTAMMSVGSFGGVEIAVGETGWPSASEAIQPWISPQTAAAYNGGLVRHIESGEGTPMMPKQRIEVYIFALFQENKKTGFIAERNFGLFNPDFTPVYDAGVMRGGGGGPGPLPLPGPQPGPLPVANKQWCIPKRTATKEQLQANLDFVCSQGLDCKPLQIGGHCFEPDTVLDHAAYAMNTWYQAKGHQDVNCDFSGTGQVVTRDPTHGDCVYVG